MTAIVNTAPDPARVRALLTDGLAEFEARKTAHTTGALARDMNSVPVSSTSEQACCWCSLGMLLKGANTGSMADPDVSAAMDLLLAAARERGHISTSRCNDTEGYDGALFMYRSGLHILNTTGLLAQADFEGSRA